jgi:chromosome segregation and condensation protein ScpB
MSSSDRTEKSEKNPLPKDKAYAILDALFFSSPTPLSIDQIKRALGLRTRSKAYRIIDPYISDFNSFHKGVNITRSRTKAYVLHLEVPMAEELRGYISPPPLTDNQLTTLAYIYKHEPVELNQVAAALGHGVYSHVSKLKRMKIVSRRKEGVQNVLRVREEALPLITTK